MATNIGSQKRAENLVRKLFSVDQSSEPVGTRSFRVIASSEAKDADGQIVAQDWDLSRYLANPVVFWNHESYGLPIGSASDVAVTDGKLHATINLVDARANPLAEHVAAGIQQRAIRGVSVGFFPKGARMVKSAEGGDVVMLTGNELVEISIVGVGSNPDAVLVEAKNARLVQGLLAKSLGGSMATHRKWADLTNRERHNLAITDRAAFDALLAEHEGERFTPSVVGKSWGDLTNMQRHALYVSDRETYDRLLDEWNNSGSAA